MELEGSNRLHLDLGPSPPGPQSHCRLELSFWVQMSQSVNSLLHKLEDLCSVPRTHE